MQGQRQLEEGDSWRGGARAEEIGNRGGGRAVGAGERSQEREEDSEGECGNWQGTTKGQTSRKPGDEGAEGGGGGRGRGPVCCRPGFLCRPGVRQRRGAWRSSRAARRGGSGPPAELCPGVLVRSGGARRRWRAGCRRAWRGEGVSSGGSEELGEGWTRRAGGREGREGPLVSRG